MERANGESMKSRLAIFAFAAALGACSAAPKSSAASLGGDCLAGGDSACASGRCLAIDSATAVCTQPCAAASDCPPAFFCAGVAGGRSCLPRELGACAADADCPAGHKCDVKASLCYVPVQRGPCAPCTSDLQCPAGGGCRAETTGERYCTAACGAGCAEGFTCASGQCVPSSGTCRGLKPLCAACRGDAECQGFGNLCVKNLVSGEAFCAKGCAGGGRCPPNFACQDLSGAGGGPFQCVPDSGSCQGFCDGADDATVARQCGLGRACDRANARCIPAADGRLCAPCADDDQCSAGGAGAMCVVVTQKDSPYRGETFCGRDCASASGGADAAKCPAGFGCVSLASDHATPPWQCVPSRGTCVHGTGGQGDACVHGAGDCLSGLCLEYGAATLCSAACAASGDCGRGWRCCAVSADGKSFDCATAPGASGVCAPSDGQLGDDCAPGRAPCETGYCLDLGTTHLCTRACGGTGPSCPAGFHCDKARETSADGTTGASVDVCFPDGGGDVGGDCAFGPAACQSHLCLKKPSGNVCTKPCAADGDCPAGFTCGSGPTVDQMTVQVCLPPGL